MAAHVVAHVAWALQARVVLGAEVAARDARVDTVLEHALAQARTYLSHLGRDDKVLACALLPCAHKRLRVALLVLGVSEVGHLGEAKLHRALGELKAVRVRHDGFSAQSTEGDG